jgi:ubiquinone/menaquinone biosynthesis C-methylase UbiE
MESPWISLPEAERLVSIKWPLAMSEPETPPTDSKWQSLVSLLRCVQCRGPLQFESCRALRCQPCSRDYPIERDILRLNSNYAGNNAIAAEYYNSALWPKFRFWEWLAYLPRGGERRARNEILRHLPELSGTRLLDVAMGDGRNMPLIPRDCQVVGVDISSVLLEKCQHDYGDRNIHLIVGEAESLPFPAGTFDNVLSLGALNHMNDPGKALREMARVVKPDGIVVIADEMPDLPNRQIAHKLGLRKLQQWILSRVFFLGPKMSRVILEHTELKIEPLAELALRDWHIHRIWGRMGYCLVGKPK